MRSATQEKLLELLYQALRPLVHLLIESGIGHRELAEVTKRAYVDVASKSYGIRGRDTNISRVAVMTGLTRKEVKRVRDELSGESREHVQKPIPASVILAQWHNDPKYCDADGAPRDLPFDGEGVTFADLVREYAGDIPPGAIRTELVRVGSAELLDNGSIRPLRSFYLPPEGKERLLRAFERPLALMTQNIRQNNIKPLRPKDHLTWPEMIVQVSDIDPGKRREIRESTYHEITHMAEDLEVKLGEYRLSEMQDRERNGTVSIGVGFYFFEAD